MLVRNIAIIHIKSREIYIDFHSYKIRNLPQFAKTIMQLELSKHASSGKHHPYKMFATHRLIMVLRPHNLMNSRNDLECFLEGFMRMLLTWREVQTAHILNNKNKWTIWYMELNLTTRSEIISVILKRVWQNLIDFMFFLSKSSTISGKTVFQPMFRLSLKKYQ